MSWWLRFSGARFQRPHHWGLPPFWGERASSLGQFLDPDSKTKQSVFPVWAFEPLWSKEDFPSVTDRMLVLFYVLLSFDSMGHPVLAQILVVHLAGNHCCYTAGALLSPESHCSDDLCKVKGRTLGLAIVIRWWGGYLLQRCVENKWCHQMNERFYCGN